jgi:hypothetical protein
MTTAFVEYVAANADNLGLQPGESEEFDFLDANGNLAHVCIQANLDGTLTIDYLEEI